MYVVGGRRSEPVRFQGLTTSTRVGGYAASVVLVVVEAVVAVVVVVVVEVVVGDVVNDVLTVVDVVGTVHVVVAGGLSIVEDTSRSGKGVRSVVALLFVDVGIVRTVAEGEFVD